MADLPGEQWWPSNGTDGGCFIDANCSHCARDANEDCEILARSFREPVEEWRELDNGDLVCTAYLRDGETPAPDPAALEAAGQERLF